MITHDLGVGRTLRPGHGDVRRPRGREGAGSRHLLSPAASLHLRSPEIEAAHRRARCLDAGGDPRPAAQPAEPAAGLHLPGALPLRFRSLPRGRPGAASARSCLLGPRLLGQGPREGLPPGAPRGGHPVLSATLLSLCELTVHSAVSSAGVFAGPYIPLTDVAGVHFATTP